MQPVESKRKRRVSSRAIAFVVLGVPAGLVALLVALAYQGVYVDALRPLWVPWPSDIWKLVIGVAAFATTFGLWVAQHRSAKPAKPEGS